MKVKIAYSLELDNIPSKMRDLLKNIDGDLKDALNSNAATQHLFGLDMKKAANVDCCVESINNTRLLLASVDAELMNYGDIMVGYHNVVSQKEEEARKQSMFNEVLKNQAVDPVPHTQKKEQPGVKLDPNKQLPGDFIKKMMESKDVDEG